MEIELILLVIIGLVFLVDFIVKKRKKSFSNVIDNYEGNKRNNSFSFTNRIINFFSKKIYLLISISLISLIIVVQFIKPFTFNESVKMEIKDTGADSLKITLVDYGSSKIIPSKLLNYKFKNLNGKWIELSKVYDGDNKFYVDNMEVGNFIEMIQYDSSKKNVFVYYPFLISKNFKITNFFNEALNEALFTKKDIIKIFISKGSFKNISGNYFVQYYNHLIDIGVPRKTLYEKY